MIRLKGLPSEEEIAEAERQGIPLLIAPSIRASCNYRCIDCYVSAGKAMEGEIGIAEHEKVIGEASALGASYMTVAMVGEPFMDAAFYDRRTGTFPLLDYAEDHGIYTVVFTNAFFVTEDIAAKLKGKQVSLIGKLWSLDPATDDRLTGYRKPWTVHDGVHVPVGLKRLIDAGFNEPQDGRTRLGIDITVKALNYLDIPRIAGYGLSHAILPVIDTMIPTGRALENYELLRLTEEQNRWLYAELAKVMGSDFVKGQFVEGCATRRVGFAYDNFGEVKTCCALGAGVGNIKDAPVKDLYARVQDYRGTLPHFGKKEGMINACDTARYVMRKAGLE